MSITPFIDRGIVDIDKKFVVIPATAGMDTQQVDKYRQGISIRDAKDYSSMMSPYISSRGFPSSVRDRFDPSLEVNAFGQPKLFEDPSPASRPGYSTGPGPAPFDDIAGIFNPVTYLIDPGTQAYPVILLSPNWLDPAQMDGIIEPLAVRGSFINASIAGPVIAHSVKASLQPETGPNLLGMGTFITRFIPFKGSEIAPFFDSQNVIMGSKDIAVAGEGYSYEEQNQIEPFDDTSMFNRVLGTQKTLLEPNSSTLFYRGMFIDDPRFGILGKSSPSGMTYGTGTYVVNQQGTGNQWVNGTDSIAFGGLLK